MLAIYLKPFGNKAHNLMFVSPVSSLLIDLLQTYQLYHFAYQC